MLDEVESNLGEWVEDVSTTNACRLYREDEDGTYSVIEVIHVGDSEHEARLLEGCDSFAKTDSETGEYVDYEDELTRKGAIEFVKKYVKDSNGPGFP